MTDLAAEKYVSLVTSRRDGSTVATPVWIVALGDGAYGFTTDLTSAKVKRIRNFPSVTLQPCNAKGVIKDGTSAIAATATVLAGGDIAPIESAIKRKYKLMVPLVNVLYGLRRVFTRGKKSPPAAVRLELR
jgi:uncharacterized protein